MLETLETIFVNNFHLISTLMSLLVGLIIYNKWDKLSKKQIVTLLACPIALLYIASFVFTGWKYINWNVFIFIALISIFENKWKKLKPLWEKPLYMLIISAVFFAAFLNPKLHSFVGAIETSYLKLSFFIVSAIITGFLTGGYYKIALRKSKKLKFALHKNIRVIINKIAILGAFDLVLLMVFTSSEFIYCGLYLGGFAFGIINVMDEDEKYQKIWESLFTMIIAMLIILFSQITHNFILMGIGCFLLLINIRENNKKTKGKYEISDLGRAIISYFK